MDFSNSISFEGNSISLIPLKREHRSDLLNAAADGKLWEIWHTSVPSVKTIDNYIDLALEQKSVGSGFPFVVVHNASNSIIGSTRFCNLDMQH